MVTSIMLLAVVLASVACAGAEDAPAQDTGTVEDGQSEPGDATLAAELRFVRSGGFAGVHQELVVHPDGTVSVAVDGGSPQPVEVSADQVARLGTLIEETDLGRLDAEPEDEVDVADDFTYELQYGEQHVAVADSDLGEPYPPLIRELTELLDMHAW